MSSSIPPPPSQPPPSSDKVKISPRAIHSRHNPGPSAHATSPPTPLSATSRTASSSPLLATSSGAVRASSPEGLDMSSYGVGHRRRRSSLLNATAPGASIAGGSSRGANSHNTLNLSDEDNIIEEDVRQLHSRDGSSSDVGNGDYNPSDEDLRDDEETGLPRKNRWKRTVRKQRNTQLDQRVAPEPITAEEKKEADHNVVRKILLNSLLIALWYIFSVCISLYNKWMFDSNQLNFPFPLFTTSAHMLVQFSLACTVLYFFPSLRPQHTYQQNIHLSDMGRSRHEAEPRPLMTKFFYLTRIAPCGAATSLDIGLGNMSLKFITLTFYTMCKSSALAFVLLFAFVFRLETPTWRLVAIIGTMTIGVILMVSGEVEFSLPGFVLIISAAFFSGFRWALTQILLLRNPATSNPFSSIFFLAPIMFVVLSLLAFPVEGFWPLVSAVDALMDQWGHFMTPLFLLFPGCLAFCMTASEFALLQRTSVVTLSIAGIFKEVVTISAASLVYQDRLTPVNAVGLVVTMTAIGVYNYIKISSMRDQEQKQVHQEHTFEHIESSSPSGSDAENEDDGFDETGILLRSTSTHRSGDDNSRGISPTN